MSRRKCSEEFKQVSEEELKQARLMRLKNLDELCEKGEALLANGNPAEAFKVAVDGFQRGVHYSRVIKLGIQCLFQLGDYKCGTVLIGIIKEQGSAKSYFRVGYHLSGIKRYSISLPFLKYAFYTEPTNPLYVEEYALVLCAEAMPDKAYEILSKFRNSCNLKDEYIFYWSAMLTNRDLSDVELYCCDKLSKLSTEGKDYSRRYPLEKLAECVVRLKRVGNPQPIVRDWHFIQYGSALLYPMDNRHNLASKSDLLAVAGGRWFVFNSQYQHVRDILEKLHILSTRLERNFSRVIALPDRSSVILATAYALAYGLPYAELDQNNILTMDSLIISSSSTLLRDKAFETVVTGQVLFSYFQPWKVDTKMTGDVTGIIAMNHTFPWESGGVTFDPKSKSILTRDEDAGTTSEIVNRILVCEPEIEPEFESDVEFYLNLKDIFVGGSSGASVRRRYLTDSPVP